MSSLVFNSAQVRAKAEEISQLNAQFKTQVTDLAEKENALKSMYEGDAATAFHTAFSRDKTQMDNFYNCIEKYASVLLEIASQMEQVESQNVDVANTRAY